MKLSIEMELKHKQSYFYWSSLIRSSSLMGNVCYCLVIRSPKQWDASYTCEGLERIQKALNVNARTKTPTAILMVEAPLLQQSFSQTRLSETGSVRRNSTLVSESCLCWTLVVVVWRWLKECCGGRSHRSVHQTCHYPAEAGTSSRRHTCVRRDPRVPWRSWCWEWESPAWEECAGASRCPST